MSLYKPFSSGDLGFLTFLAGLGSLFGFEKKGWVSTVDSLLLGPYGYGVFSYFRKQLAGSCLGWLQATQGTDGKVGVLRGAHVTSQCIDAAAAIPLDKFQGGTFPTYFINQHTSS